MSGSAKEPLPARPVAEAPTESPARVIDFLEEVGGLTVHLHGDKDRGEIVLMPPEGGRLAIRIEGGRLVMEWTGDRVELRAPAGTLALSAKRVEIQAEEVAMTGTKGVAIQSGQDVEVRADHHVNLWGIGIRAGD